MLRNLSRLATRQGLGSAVAVLRAHEITNVCACACIDKTQTLAILRGGAVPTRMFSSTAPTETTKTENSHYVGVYPVEDKPGWWEAKLEASGTWLLGGTYPDKVTAAIAYDELARMIQGDEATTNFESGTPADMQWVAPDAQVDEELIPLRVKELLTVAEVVEALQNMNGLDIYTISLKDKSTIGDYMVFVTGKSTVHMRKMADSIVRALLDRKLHWMHPVVEGRDCDDWMIVDAQNIIINIMEAGYRKNMRLEEHWDKMKMGEDRYAQYGASSEEELLEMLPQPGGEEDFDGNGEDGPAYYTPDELPLALKEFEGDDDDVKEGKKKRRN